MKRINYIILSIAAAASVFACTKVDDAEYVSADELGSATKTLTVSTERGNVSFDVVANKSGKATVLTGGEWLAIADPSFDGDKTLVAEYLENTGYPRHAKILLETESRKDTVTVRQEGREESFNFPNTSVTVMNGKGDTKIEAELSMPLRELDVEIIYSEEEGWIKEYGIDRSKLWIRTEDNTDTLALRHAKVIVKWVDGWGQSQTQNLTITQANAKNLFGTPVTFEELREMATVEGADILDDIVITANIGGAPENGQAGSCDVEDILSGTIDYDSNDITAYMQDLDGNNGIRITTLTADDNIFKRNTQVNLLLKGAVIAVSEDLPTRYYLKDVTSKMVLESTEITLPAKEMYINDLQDKDIYTYVTLKDCEIPTRKGPFTPINEGYSKAFNNGFIGKFPLVIHDKEGGSMYMMTNITCPYRRDGNRMPYGSGNISGIIVHEYYRPFADYDNSVEKYCGYIGDYQIRHLCREDIDLADDFSNSFSGLVTEFRYLKQPADPSTTELPKAILATAGNGCLTHTYESYNSVLSLRTTNFTTSFCYLGPVGSKYKGDYSSGCGIILDDGTDYIGSCDAATHAAKSNSDGKGGMAQVAYLSWGNKYWWDSAAGRGYCWLIKCSTKGISSDRASVQFSMYNNFQASTSGVAYNTKSPRYWKIQYSTSTSDCSASKDGEWHTIGEFTVPDVMTWATQQYGQSLGAKSFSFELPASEVLDRETLYVRLMPRNSKACSHTAGGYYYDASAIVNNSGGNTMDYFAIRYNK